MKNLRFLCTTQGPLILYAPFGQWFKPTDFLSVNPSSNLGRSTNGLAWSKEASGPCKTRVVSSILIGSTKNSALSNNWFSSPVFQVGNSGSSPDSATKIWGHMYQGGEWVLQTCWKDSISFGSTKLCLGIQSWEWTGLKIPEIRFDSGTWH